MKSILYKLFGIFVVVSIIILAIFIYQKANPVFETEIGSTAKDQSHLDDTNQELDFNDYFLIPNLQMEQQTRRNDKILENFNTYLSLGVSDSEMNKKKFSI